MNTFISSLILSFWALAMTVKAQQQEPQWKFHLAFEDATGAKDTIWMIWDSTATNHWPVYQYDFHLGEEPIQMQDNILQMYIKTYTNDSVKTIAFPYLLNEPAFQNFYLDAANVTYPLIMKWDSSLFKSPALVNDSVCKAYFDNDWAFFEPGQTFNMLQTDSVFLPQPPGFSQSQFPMLISFTNSYSSSCWVGVSSGSEELDFKLFPNPVYDFLTFSFKIEPKTPVKVEILEINANKVIKSVLLDLNDQKIDLTELPKGLYFIKINYSNQIYHEKIVKY
jgi:hypothetical protein